MREDQADQIVDLLTELLEELRGHRTDFMEFTGYNVYKMSEALDTITGPTGYHLGDLNDRLGEVTGAISSLESTVDLK